MIWIIFPLWIVSISSFTVWNSNRLDKLEKEIDRIERRTIWK